MSFSTVTKTEVDVGTINVNLMATATPGYSTHKSTEKFAMTFTGVPKVIACLRNVNDSLSSANQVRVTSNISNITVDGFDYECQVYGSGSLAIDYTAVYHVDTNPFGSIFGRKVTIKSTTHNAYLSNNNGYIETYPTVRKYEEWVIEKAPGSPGNFVYFFSKTFNKYLTCDPVANTYSHGPKGPNAKFDLAGTATACSFYSDSGKLYMAAHANGDIIGTPYAGHDLNGMFEINIVP